LLENVASLLSDQCITRSGIWTSTTALFYLLELHGLVCISKRSDYRGQVAMQCLQRSTRAARIQPAVSSSVTHCHHSIRRWPLHHGARLPQIDGAQRNFACRAYKPNKPDLGDSVIAALPYLLPLMDVLPYGELWSVFDVRVADALLPPRIFTGRWSFLLALAWLRPDVNARRRTLPVHAVPIHRPCYGTAWTRLLALQLIPTCTVSQSLLTFICCALDVTICLPRLLRPKSSPALAFWLLPDPSYLLLALVAWALLLQHHVNH
jgi:hypothetical protein